LPVRGKIFVFPKGGKVMERPRVGRRERGVWVRGGEKEGKKEDGDPAGKIYAVHEGVISQTIKRKNY